jgi:hypothetical protein
MKSSSSPSSSLLIKDASFSFRAVAGDNTSLELPTQLLFVIGSLWQNVLRDHERTVCELSVEQGWLCDKVDMYLLI